MLQQYILVDEEGYQVDVLLLDSDIDEITEFHISDISEGLFVPKWDYENSIWVEGLSEEDASQRREEVESQQREFTEKPTIEDLIEENRLIKEENNQIKLENRLIIEEANINAHAIMELAEMIFLMQMEVE